MERRLRDVLLFLAMCFFAFAFLFTQIGKAQNFVNSEGHAISASTANPCSQTPSQDTGAKSQIPAHFKIQVKGVFHQDQINYRLELRELLLQSLWDDANNKADPKKLKRIKKLAAKLRFKE